MVRAFGIQEIDHTANILHAINLGAQVSSLVKIAPHQIAVLKSGDNALALYAYATRTAYDLAAHVLSRYIRDVFGHLAHLCFKISL